MKTLRILLFIISMPLLQAQEKAPWVDWIENSLFGFNEEDEATYLELESSSELYSTYNFETNLDEHVSTRIQCSALGYAVYRGNAEAVKRLLINRDQLTSNGEFCELKDNVQKCYSLLQLAVRFGGIEVVAALAEFNRLHNSNDYGLFTHACNSKDGSLGVVEYQIEILLALRNNFISRRPQSAGHLKDAVELFKVYLKSLYSSMCAHNKTNCILKNMNYDPVPMFVNIVDDKMYARQFTAEGWKTLKEFLCFENKYTDEDPNEISFGQFMRYVIPHIPTENGMLVEPMRAWYLFLEKRGCLFNDKNDENVQKALSYLQREYIKIPDEISLSQFMAYFAPSLETSAEEAETKFKQEKLATSFDKDILLDALSNELLRAENDRFCSDRIEISYGISLNDFIRGWNRVHQRQPQLLFPFPEDFVERINNNNNNNITELDPRNETETRLPPLGTPGSPWQYGLQWKQIDI